MRQAKYCSCCGMPLNRDGFCHRCEQDQVSFCEHCGKYIGGEAGIEYFPSCIECSGVDAEIDDSEKG